MKQKLIDELKKFFNMDKEDKLVKLAEDRKIRTISGLAALITSLNDPAISPKEIAQQLENIIVCISIKNNNVTDLEQSLKNILENYQEELATSEIKFQEGVSSFTTSR